MIFSRQSEDTKSKTNGKSTGKKKPFANKKKLAKNSANEETNNGNNDKDNVSVPKKSAVTNGNAGENTNNAKTTVKSNKENDLSKNEPIHNKPKKQKQYPATVSVFVGKIPRGTRVKELKEVIIAKGVKPVNILWKGGKGYALIYCEKKDVPSSEELFEKLKNLSIGESVLNVEPDKRIKQLKDINNENDATKVQANGDNNKNPSNDKES